MKKRKIPKRTPEERAEYDEWTRIGRERIAERRRHELELEEQAKRASNR